MITRRYCGYCGADLTAAGDGEFCGQCGAPRDGTVWTLTNAEGAPPPSPDILHHMWRLTVTVAGATPTRQIIVAATLLVTTLILLGAAYHLLLGCVPLLLIALMLHLWLPHQDAPRAGRPGRSAGATEKARPTEKGRTHER